MFAEKLKETLNETQKSVTENGAIGYRTSGKELLDLNFAVSSLRNCSEEKIVEMFKKAFYEDKLLALKWLFYARDVRGGLGERRLFRSVMKYLANTHTAIANALIPLIAEYGRYDDLIELLDTRLCNDVAGYLKEVLYCDLKSYKAGKPITLLAKWMPSANTSSSETKRKAGILIEKFGIPERKYRKMLSKLRAYLDVTEVKMSSNQWDAIDYEKVPSRANLKYSDAFLRNDRDRREMFLESLVKGEAKINAGTLFPHDIVVKYRMNGNYNDTYEELWRALPDTINGKGNTICVADGSGSMYTGVSGSLATAWDVATALAIYFAERCSGDFHDKYITFSERPQLVNLKKANSLYEKIEVARCYSEVGSTNVEAVFELILDTAKRYNMKQEDMPQNVLILSDMEFNDATYGYTLSENLFSTLSRRYQKEGYKLPRLVFWNVCSRTLTVPVQQNDLGVALVSGFSTATMEMVLSNETDPYKCLLDTINKERYKPVEDAVASLLTGNDRELRSANFF